MKRKSLDQYETCVFGGEAEASAPEVHEPRTKVAYRKQKVLNQ